jgi:hypothetical protein
MLAVQQKILKFFVVNLQKRALYIDISVTPLPEEIKQHLNAPLNDTSLTRIGRHVSAHCVCLYQTHRSQEGFARNDFGENLWHNPSAKSLNKTQNRSTILVPFQPLSGRKQTLRRTCHEKLVRRLAQRPPGTHHPAATAYRTQHRM